MKHSRTAFTLVELLVTVLIVICLSNSSRVQESLLAQGAGLAVETDLRMPARLPPINLRDGSTPIGSASRRGFLN